MKRAFRRSGECCCARCAFAGRECVERSRVLQSCGEMPMAQRERADDDGKRNAVMSVVVATASPWSEMRSPETHAVSYDRINSSSQDEGQASRNPRRRSRHRGGNVPRALACSRREGLNRNARAWAIVVDRVQAHARARSMKPQSKRQGSPARSEPSSD